tara:strand:- start:24 stop:287 length:264 start_codon:yes stop_codon:yes gene_type:complete
MKCLFCESAKNEYWFGNFCESCRKIKNLANVYGFDRVLTILEKTCIRNPDQLENKIKNHNHTLKTIPEDIKEELNKVATRSKKKEHN